MDLSSDDITAVYRALLLRDPEPGAVGNWLATGIDLETLLRSGLNSDEFKDRVTRDFSSSTDKSVVNHIGINFRAPADLEITPTPLKRVLLVGQCLLDRWPQRLREMGVDTPVDRLFLTHEPPPQPPFPFDQYSFQISHIATRSILPDYMLFSWLLGRDDGASGSLLGIAKQTLELVFAQATVWAKHFPVFITNLLVPQLELNGRLIKNPTKDSLAFIFNELNSTLSLLISQSHNVFLLDIDGISASLGRRHVQDESLVISTHGSILDNSFYEEDQKRIDKIKPPTDYYEIHESDFVGGVWREAVAMYRTLRQIDQVKMVCVDLDDTLWRGVLAEDTEIDPETATGGWPRGIVEALAAMKRRGVLLAVISKNTEEKVLEIFRLLYRDALTLDDFAIVKINWRSKIENIEEAMKEANVLPRSVVFLDDNPIERAAVKAAFPEIRVIDAPVYYWRRILLGSPETQVVTVTDESARRTEMTRAQGERETVRGSMSHEQFLMQLQTRVHLKRVDEPGKRFDRALELLNKSNQFNTTGERWTAQELEAFCSEHLTVSAEVSDKYVDYGITLIILIRDGCFWQLVMSCRVINLGVEQAAVSELTGQLLQQYGVVHARMIPTESNVLARDLFAKAGWQQDHEEWVTSRSNASPGHIELSSDL